MRTLLLRSKSNNNLEFIEKNVCTKTRSFAQDDNFDIYVYPVILSEAKNLILTKSNYSINQNLKTSRRDPIGHFVPSRMTVFSFILTLSFWSEAIESHLNAI